MQVGEKVRQSLFKLRSTWTEFFPANQLYELDMKVKLLDPAWPVMAVPTNPPVTVVTPAIHVNPRFIKKVRRASLRQL